MIYEEFAHLKQLIDNENPLINLYQYDTGEMFYVEPMFYTYITGFKDRVPEKIPEILKEMERVVKLHKNVIFTGDYENPQTIKEGFIYLEIEDITNPLQIFYEDKSRGSDYGD